MKTKKLLALLLAAMFIVGTLGAFGAYAQEVDATVKLFMSAPVSEIKFGKTINRPEGSLPPSENGVVLRGFDYPGFFYFAVRGADQNDRVTWEVKKGGIAQEIPAHYINGSGLTLGPDFNKSGPMSGAYTVTVSVEELVAGTWQSKGTDTHVAQVPDRTALRTVLENDDTIRFGFLYDGDTWGTYRLVRTQILEMYNDLSETQDRLDLAATIYQDAVDDLAINQGRVYEFLWHMFRLFTNWLNLIPGGSQYKL